jgi:sigma-B regulation protein RsbU (phosphoserine phosphatase)
MEDQLFRDILGIQGYLVMERQSDRRFTIMGPIPDWFTRIFGKDSLRGSVVVPEALSPFIENFLPIAEQAWLEHAPGILKSGPWTETDPSGIERHLELSALKIGFRQILLLQILGEEYEERKDLLQRCREQGLDYEILDRTQKALKAAHELLLEKQRQLRQDLEAAAEIQTRFLPKDVPMMKGIRLATKFQPCTLIAGDMYNVILLDDDHLGIYILDVSGHGAPAAMLAVSVCQMLQPYSGVLMNSDPRHAFPGAIASPRQVLQALDREFPIERFDKYFTIFYAVLDCANGVLTYSNAGHPEPILLHPDGDIDSMDKGGTIIGMGGILPYEEEQKALQRGDKIILYSDGVTELENPKGELFGVERLRSLVRDHRDRPIADLLDAIHLSLVEFGGPHGPQDDLTLLGIEFDSR